MKKVLKFLGILILILLVGYLVLCIATPKESTIETSKVIDAPKSVVWEQVTKFNNWPNWSAWKEVDSTVKIDVTGTDGSEGAVYHYVGKKLGEGSMTNMGTTATEMKYKMAFKPDGGGDGSYKISEEGGKTKITMTYHQETPFLMRGVYSLVFKGMLTHMFDRGFELLQIYSEAHKDDTAIVNNIQDVAYPAHIFAGVRKVVKWSEIGAFCGETYGALGGALGARINGAASAIYYSWDEANQQTDMYPCFPVADNAATHGATIVEVPASQAYMMHYVGGYTGSKAAHEALGAHMAANGKTMGLVIEEYIKGPGQTPDSNQYETNIYYLHN